MKRRAVLALLALCLSLPPARAAGQARYYAGGLVGAGRLDSELGGPDTPRDELTGALFGFEGRASIWKLEVDVRYVTGTFEADGSRLALDLVEAELLLGVRPISWITLRVGPHARSFTPESGGTDRWLFWEVRGRVEPAVLAPQLRTYFEIWAAVAGEVNFGSGFGGGRGLEAGLTYRLRQAPFWGRIGYRVDRGSLESGARKDSVQELLLVVGVGAR